MLKNDKDAFSNAGKELVSYLDGIGFDSSARTIENATTLSLTYLQTAEANGVLSADAAAILANNNAELLKGGLRRVQGAVKNFANRKECEEHFEIVATEIASGLTDNFTLRIEKARGAGSPSDIVR